MFSAAFSTKLLISSGEISVPKSSALLERELTVITSPSENNSINSIAPGCIKTDMNSYLPEEALEGLKEILAIKKIGEGIDIAKCVKWLIEDTYTTGQIIRIDGGWNI